MRKIIYDLPLNQDGSGPKIHIAHGNEESEGKTLHYVDVIVAMTPAVFVHSYVSLQDALEQALVETAKRLAKIAESLYKPLG